MLCGFSVFSLIESDFKLLLLVLPFLIFATGFFPFKKVKCKRHFIILAAISLFVSLLLSFVYFDLWFKADKRFQNEDVRIQGEVISVTKYYDSCNIEIKTHSINDKPFTRYKLKATLDTSEEQLNPGNIIEICGKITGFEENDGGFDEKTYNYSRGFSGSLIDITALTVLNSKISEPGFFSKINQTISFLIKSRADENTAGLLIALLLGDRSLLPKKLAFDIKRIGLSHMLALSGMHLAILVLGFVKLLSYIGVGKITRKFLIIPITLTYMLLTGMPVSVVRAGLMLIISSLLFIFAKSSDSLTTLCISAALIVIINPVSIFDLSFWLSALATFGIVSLSDMPEDYEKKRSFKSKILDVIKSSLMVSCFAISATLLMSVFSFDGISLIAPITTLLFSFPIELFMTFGIVLIIFGGIIPLGTVLTKIYESIAAFSASISSLKYINISSGFLLLKISVIAFTVAFVIFLVVKIKRKKSALALLSVFYVLLFASTPLYALKVENTNTVNYHRLEKTESFIICGEGEVSLIDEDNYRKNTAYYTLEAVKSDKLSHIDNYIICDYSYSLPEKISVILSNIKVYRLFMPVPENDFEENILHKTQELLEEFSVKLNFYATGEKIKFGISEFTQVFRSPYDINGSKNGFSIDFLGESLGYISSNTLSGKTRAAALSTIRDKSCIVLGRHGTSYGNYYFTYELKEAKVIIFSSKNLFISNYFKENYSDTDLYFESTQFKFIR